MRPPVNSSAVHVLQTLRLVCASDTPLSHAEISRRTALPSTTVYRALSTLEDAQYVQRAQGALGYETGIVPQLLLWTLLKRFPLTGAAAPFLHRLAEQSGGTASLCVRLGWYGLRVAVVYGGNDIYHRDRLGEVTVLHATQATRGIFAFLSGEEVDAYRRFVQRHHDDYARDIDRLALRREVADTRKLGYCAAAAESAGESPSFAMPLRGADGRVAASIALSGSALETAPGVIPSLPGSWRATWAAFETALAGDPARTASPYAHLDPNDIAIRLPGAAVP